MRMQPHACVPSRCAIGLAAVVVAAACAGSVHAAGSGTVAAAATDNATPQAPVNVQAVSPGGLSVRVKKVELGEDATILTVNASFASRTANYAALASADTFIEDADGKRLMLKRPEGNRYLKVMNGDTMEGQLVFLGAVAPSADQIQLVMNHGNLPDDANGPGISITLPLKELTRQ